MATREPDIEYTPVRSRRGRKVHAVTLRSAERTACGLRTSGWVIALALLNCRDCKLAAGLDARPKGRRREVRA